MAQSDSARAIGAVTRLLSEHLLRRGFAVAVGRAQSAAGANSGPILNLFLYEASFDASLRNVQLQPDAPAPLWLALKYLLTAFDIAELSDSSEAHELLGQGLAALQDMNFLSLDAAVASGVRAALESNPEPLKITFDDSPADLVSKIMQGDDEPYRFSLAFEVRPVMILAAQPPAMAPLVGIDSSATPPAIGGDGVGVTVLPSLGARLERLAPAVFEPGEQIELHGDDLHASGLECWLGPIRLSVVARQPDRLMVVAEGEVEPPATEGPVAAGAAISAGEHPIVVRKVLESLRVRSSNLLIGRLRPIVTQAQLAADGTLTIDGTLLGTESDDVLVALRRGGSIVSVFEPGPSGAEPTVVVDDAQHHLTVAGLTAPTVAAGDYQVVVRVNSQQARLNPTVTVA